jgi:antitoxin YefM
MNVLPIVKATNVTNLRKNIKKQFDYVTDLNTTLIVTRNDDKNVVVIAENEYEKMMRNINNLTYTLKLLKSANEADNRDFIEVTFAELETYE